MAKRTRVIPKEFSEPVPLTDAQVTSLKALLAGFRSLFLVVDDNVPSGPEKEAVVRELGRLKLSADAAVRAPSEFTMARLADLFAEVEFGDQRVEKLVLNPQDFAGLRRDPNFKDSFDASTDRDAIRAGVSGTLWNASVYILRCVPVGRAVLAGERDKLEISKDWAPSEDQLVVI